MATRIERLRARMSEESLPAFLVTRPENVFYLAGFSGSAGMLVITPTHQLLLTDFRYLLHAAEVSPDWEVVQVDPRFDVTLRRVLSGLGVERVGFESDHLTVASYYQYGGDDASLPYVLTPAPELVEGLRLVKEPDELARIREAVRITDAAYQHVLNCAKPGISERELALEADWFMRHHGAQGPAFEIIIATGAHSALPHAEPDTRPLQSGDLVVVDMGACVAHYCADMTRTFAVGDPPPLACEIYRICLRAQLAGLDGIRAGITGRDADGIVRAVIEDAGYGAEFGHGTGHGVGLAIHEAPRLNRLSEEVLPAGTLVTVEPGIYLPDFGGVRIEDLCVLTATGVEVLTGTPKPPELPVCA